MSDTMLATYLALERALHAAESESPEAEDAVLAKMDEVWLQLSDEEVRQLDARGDVA